MGRAGVRAAPRAGAEVSLPCEQRGGAEAIDGRERKKRPFGDDTRGDHRNSRTKVETKTVG